MMLGILLPLIEVLEGIQVPNIESLGHQLSVDVDAVGTAGLHQLGVAEIFFYVKILEL
jgi:hypothetical protein